ncbi:MAG: 2TM domain-containing protein [Chryseobacterium sp.]|uniref:2TM domain-containing protein n=1 Tax=Chryseobacterium sp. TaxID=1871047 RepID=UPI0025C2FCA8|nr:2TM domain-containing protein [Chryseobacterium sp.]MCJ7934003.1 2TM domain-containing protein [Chryseobacterium sp.]
MDYNSAYTRANDLKKFYKSIFFFAIIAVLIFPSDQFEEKIIRIKLFDGYIILGIWALILVIKAIKLFIFDSEWEKEMIEKELRKDKQPIDY